MSSSPPVMMTFSRMPVRGDQPQALRVPCLDRLSPQNRRRDGDRHRRELHVAQHLVADAVGRRGR